MKVEDIKKFQTVSIWGTRKGDYLIRGYYRGCSYPLGSHTDLEAAFSAAVQISRKQDAIAVVPALEGDAS